MLQEKIEILQAEIQKLKSLIKLKENNSQNVFRLNGEIQKLKRENENLKGEINEIKEKSEIKLESTNSISFYKYDVNKLEEKLKRFSMENKFLTDQIYITK